MDTQLHIIDLSPKTHELPFFVHTYHKNFYQTKWGWKNSAYCYLYYINEGSGTVVCNNKKYNVTKGDFLFCQSGSNIRYLPSDTLNKNGVNYYLTKYIGFGGFAVNDILNYFSIPKSCIFKSSAIENHLDVLLSNIENNKDPEVVSYKLYSFLIKFGKNYYNKVSLRGFQKAIDFTEQNFYRQISATDAATYAGISESYLFKQFKKVMNTSFNNYLNSLRINWAKHYLINEPELSCEDISTLVGYNSASYFIKSFKTIEGVTPYKYKKENINKTL